MLLERYSDMHSFGEYLKKERESKGVTIEEISFTTRINKKFLNAIERDDFQALPHKTFARGFIIAYSKCVGLDPTEVMARYNEFTRKPEETSEEPPKELPHFAQETNWKSVALVIGITCTLLLVILLFNTGKDRISEKHDVPETEESDLQKSGEAGYGEDESTGDAFDADSVDGNSQRNKDLAGLTVTPEEGEDNSVPSPSIPSVKDTVERKEIGLSGRGKKTVQSSGSISSVPAKDLTLKLRTKEESWVNIIIDDTETIDIILDKNRTKSWKAREKFLFSTGNIKGIELLLNGNNIDIPKKRGRVLKNFLITRSEQKILQ